MRRKQRFIGSITLSFALTLSTAFTAFAELPDDSVNYPESTLPGEYGFWEEPDYENMLDAVLSAALGTQTVDNVQILKYDGTAIDLSKAAKLVLTDSYIFSEATEDLPAVNDSDRLFIAGDMATVIAKEQSHSYFINSTIVSRSGAGIFADAPVNLEGFDNLPEIYLYGSEVITADGGYGADSNYLSNLFVYGSHIQAAEIGLISGNCGRITTGDFDNASDNEALFEVLEEKDIERWEEDAPDTIIEGGRNALVIYHDYIPVKEEPEEESTGFEEGESSGAEGIPNETAEFFDPPEEVEETYYITEVLLRNSTLRTDLSLDPNLEYEPWQQAYIDHTKGSVIVITSTESMLTMIDTDLIADPYGTGYLIQTIPSTNTDVTDLSSRRTLPYGSSVSMIEMEISGDISHEDFQRDLYLILDDTSFEGAMYNKTYDDWEALAQFGEFTDRLPERPEEYEEVRGIHVTLNGGSSWTVTADSRLKTLIVGENSSIEGLLYVNGVQQEILEGIYEGDVLLTPIPNEEETTEAPTEPSTEAPTTAETQPETTTAHTHNFINSGGYPASCTANGVVVYTCSGCGEKKEEVLTALGHDYYLSKSLTPSCEVNGSLIYACSRCDDTRADVLPASGHQLSFQYTKEASCEASGADVYSCTVCGAVVEQNQAAYPATGHWYSYPLPAFDNDPNLYHTHYCSTCGASSGSYEAHTWVTGYGSDTHWISCTTCGYQPENNIRPHNWTYYSFDSLIHYVQCTDCFYIYEENHYATSPCICGHTGPVG